MNNEHKELCLTCRYRGRIGTKSETKAGEGISLICNYLEITGHPRILECYDPRDCTVYEPGGRRNMNRAPKRNKKK